MKYIFAIFSKMYRKDCLRDNFWRSKCLKTYFRKHANIAAVCTGFQHSFIYTFCVLINIYKLLFYAGFTSRLFFIRNYWRASGSAVLSWAFRLLRQHTTCACCSQPLSCVLCLLAVPAVSWLLSLANATHTNPNNSNNTGRKEKAAGRLHHGLGTRYHPWRVTRSYDSWTCPEEPTSWLWLSPALSSNSRSNERW